MPDTEKKFSELETAASMDGTEFVAMSQSQNGVLASVKATLQALANWIASGSRYASALNTQDKTLTGAINEVLADAGSDVSVTNTIPSSDETKRVATVTVDGTPTDINADDTEAILRRVFGEHTVEGNPVTFDAYLGLETVKSLTLTMNPIQSGSGDPSPTNIRPISGRDSVDVVVTGKNMLPNEATTRTVNGITYTVNADGTVSVSGTATAESILNLILNYENIMDGILSGCPSGGGANAYSIQALNETSTTVVATDTGNGVNVVARKFGRIRIRIANGYTANNLLFKPMIRPTGSSAEYEPYTAQTKTITFPSTVYGGTDEVVGGVGSSEWGYIASYNGETLPSEWISDRDVYAPNTTPTTGAEVAYKLATPTPFSTTPTQIPLNKGNNVVSTDADDLSLKYSVDLSSLISGE